MTTVGHTNGALIVESPRWLRDYTNSQRDSFVAPACTACGAHAFGVQWVETSSAVRPHRTWQPRLTCRQCGTRLPGDC
jgi:hypothetical protein